MLTLVVGIEGTVWGQGRERFGGWGMGDGGWRERVGGWGMGGKHQLPLLHWSNDT